jgi:heme-degrading monooxygenase HmoA
MLASNKGAADMITEIAQIEVKPGTEKDFEAAVARAEALAPVKGHHGLELHRSIEKPRRYLLIGEWDTVDDHLAFRASQAFAEWRALVGPYFASPPDVEHTETVVSIVR